MNEKIDEKVGVIVVYDAKTSPPVPRRIKWRGRYIEIERVDLCHPVWEGKTLHHVYSVCDEANYYRLDFNTRSQQWTLEEIGDGGLTQ